MPSASSRISSGCRSSGASRPCSIAFAGKMPGRQGTRVRAALRFDGVSKVQSSNVKRGAAEAVVSLLAIRFTPNGEDDPAGVIELVLAGGGTIRLTVECIDAELADQTGPWAGARPAQPRGSLADGSPPECQRKKLRRRFRSAAVRQARDRGGRGLGGARPHRRRARARRCGAGGTDQQIRPRQHHRPRI